MQGTHCALPATGECIPGAQGRHCSALAEYVPLGQRAQAAGEALASPMLPGGQAVHTAILAFLYEPRVQGSQVGTPALVVPFPVPGGQGAQACAPVDAEMDPAAHALHAAMPGVLKCCSGQGVQALAPGCEEAPAGHWLHAAAELAPSTVP